MGRKKLITPEVLSEVKTRYLSGESLSIIARDFGFNERWIRERLKMIGVSARINYRSLLTRFWSKVKIASSDGCWEWIGAKIKYGYGVLRANGQSRMAYRISYELFIGEIPDGLELDHLCRNPGCVHPYHLEPVTHRENMMRSPVVPAAVNDIKTHCVHGHEFSATNTRYSKDGHRRCLECTRIRSGVQRARRKLTLEQK